MSTANHLDTRFGEAPVADLSFIDELTDRTGDFFDRHRRVDAVLVKQVDPVCPQPTKRCLGDLLNMLGPAVERRGLLDAFNVDVPTKFCRDHDLITERLDRLADDLFINPRSVNLRCVEESDSALICRTYQLDAVFLVEAGPKPEADAHASEAER